MINFQIGGVMSQLTFLRQHLGVARIHAEAQGTAPLPEAYKFAMTNSLTAMKGILDPLMVQSIDDRFHRIWDVWDGQVSWSMWCREIQSLYEAIEDGLRYKKLYLYPEHKARVLLHAPTTWSATNTAFPSARAEVEDALDCYALEKNTACVFHLMRVAEYGLRALARERKIVLPKGKPVEWATWQDILNNVEKTVNGTNGIAKTAKTGPRKDEALRFYNGAIGQFLFFKDQYRNAIMHVRVRYEEHQALSAIEHVREFMNGLSGRLSEQTKGPIRWKL